MQLNYQSREEQSLKSNLYLNAKSLTTCASQMYNDYDSDSLVEFEIVYTLPQGYIMGQIFKMTNPNDSRDEFFVRRFRKLANSRQNRSEFVKSSRRDELFEEKIKIRLLVRKL